MNGKHCLAVHSVNVACAVDCCVIKSSTHKVQTFFDIIKSDLLLTPVVPSVSPPTSCERLTVNTGRSGSSCAGDLPLPAGAAGRLSGDGPPRLAAVPVQSDDLAGPRRQLT